MILYICFYRKAENEELILEHDCFSTVKNLKDCKFLFEKAKIAFFNKDGIPDGEYLIKRETNGRKVRGFLSWKEKDTIVFKKKYKDFKVNDSISFPAGCGVKSKRSANIEFVDEEGLGLDFILDRNGKQEESSQEYWTFEELEEIGAI